jgi:Lrp/AsnC family leucine-responsive transcriptional regulator
LSLKNRKLANFILDKILIAGEDAFLVKVRVADNEELGQFIRDKIWSIKAVKATRTSIVLSTFKETGRIPIDDPSS